jgi:RHS repeat-associated protein
MLKDHLGSASIVTNASGTIVGEDRFYPFGETRFTTGTMLTDKLYTGQREITGLGIYHYGARFYSPKLGCFLSADMMTSNPDNPQRFNHYTYGLNNPLRYSDPTGHRACDDVDEFGECITAPGGGGRGFGGTQPKKPRRDGGDPSTPNPSTDPCAAGNFSPRCPGWHFYRTTNIVCPAYLQCTAEQMQNYLYRFVYPSQDSNNPVSNGDINSVWIGIFPLGQIRTRVAGLTITNITEPNHLMYNGQVERRAVQNSDGSWSIVTTGMGNNRQIPIAQRPSPSGPVLGPPAAYVDYSSINTYLGPGAFNDLDQAMLNYIVEHQ